MAELDEEILLSTGGISYSPYVTSSLANLEGYTHGVTFASHALNDKSSEMYRLMTKILLETNFDQPDRIKTLILNSASALNGSVADSGHTFARGFASGILSESAVRLTCNNF
jgi:Zn-dependent M16 (insulinase) family peptidase